MTDDFFRSGLDQMIDHSHPLAVLASRLAWEKMESGVAPQLAHKVRPLGTSEEALDLAGAVVRVSGGTASNAGRPRLDTRLMIALTLHKYSFDLSDEELVQRFAENVYWQYFAGFECIDPRSPCDATQIGHFGKTPSPRCMLGEAGLEELLSATIHTAIDVSAVKKSELQRVIMDTTVQEKAVAHPVDSRLLVDARTFPGNPYDGHILAAQMEQSTILLQDLDVRAKQVVVDLGFRGKDVDQANPELEIIHRGRIKSMTKTQRRWLKRRQAVEPAIWHLKSDNRMQRCWLQGQTGDALHTLCCALGYNLRWLMRAVVRLGLKGLLLCLFALAYGARLAFTRVPAVSISGYVSALDLDVTPRLAPAGR